MNESTAIPTQTRLVGTRAALRIRQADWQQDHQALAQVRRTVFIEEQDVSEALEWDEHDGSSLHFLATVTDSGQGPGQELPIGTARLTHEGQIGRMAVLIEWRHQGVATALLKCALKTAEQEGLRPLFLHAQTHAISFYEAHGFVAEGAEFDDAGIPHRYMVLKPGQD